MKKELLILANDVYNFFYDLDPYTMDTREETLPYIAGDIMHGAEAFRCSYDNIVSLEEEYNPEDIVTLKKLSKRIDEFCSILGNHNLKTKNS